MGTISCCIDNSSEFKAADWIAISGILINAALGIWIVRTLQLKLTNKRVLKDHLISEIKEIRNEFRTWLSNLYLNQTLPKDIIPWFKLMNIKVDDIITILNTKYKIDSKVLNPFQNDLRDLITDHPDYITQFKMNNPVVLSEDLINSLMKFQQKHNSLFNSLIIKINDGR